MAPASSGNVCRWWPHFWDRVTCFAVCDLSWLGWAQSLGALCCLRATFEKCSSRSSKEAWALALKGSGESVSRWLSLQFHSRDQKGNKRIWACFAARLVSFCEVHGGKCSPELGCWKASGIVEGFKDLHSVCVESSRKMSHLVWCWRKIFPGWGWKVYGKRSNRPWLGNQTRCPRWSCSAYAFLMRVLLLPCVLHTLPLLSLPEACLPSLCFQITPYVSFPVYKCRGH